MNLLDIFPHRKATPLEWLILAIVVLANAAILAALIIYP